MRLRVDKMGRGRQKPSLLQVLVSHGMAFDLTVEMPLIVSGPSHKYHFGNNVKVLSTVRDSGYIYFTFTAIAIVFRRIVYVFFSCPLLSDEGKWFYK